MHSKTMLIALLAGGVAVAGGALTATSSGQSAEPAPLTLVLPHKEQRVTLVDLPPRKTKRNRSESPGDQAIQSGTVRDAAGKRVGSHYSVATVVKGRTPGTTEQYQTTFVLTDGQISAQGVIDQVGSSESLSIVGGTGAYAGARGEMTITGDDKAVRFVLRMRQPQP